MKWVVLGVLGLSLGCGSSGAEPDPISPNDGGQVDAAPAEGCVDITAGEFNYAMDYPFWRDARGVHFVSGTAVTNGAIELRSFDPSSGVATGSTELIRPSDVGAFGRLNPAAVAATPEGRFAVLYFFRTGQSEDTLVNRVLLGSSDGAPVRTWEPPWPAFPVGTISLHHVGWDGEAFVLHGYDSSTGKLAIARLSPDGELVTPLSTPVKAAAVQSGLFDYESDAVSGLSLMVSDYMCGISLTGHRRDGSPLPALGSAGIVAVRSSLLFPEECRIRPADGSDALCANVCPSATTPGVGAATERILLGWFDTVRGVNIQLLDPTPAPLGPTWLLPAPDTIRWSVRRDLAVAHARDRFWVIVATSLGIRAVEVTDDGVVAEEPLVTDTPSQCLLSRTCPVSSYVGFDARMLSTFTWQDEMWVGFADLSEDQSADWNTGSPGNRPYRIVLGKKGCVYSSAYDLRHREKGD